MSPTTLIAVCAYSGDAHQVQALMPAHMRSGNPIVILSPKDSPVILPGFLHHQAGRAAYVGPDSLTRQQKYLEILLKFPQDFFLLHDADSLMLSAQVPEQLYKESQKVIWSGEIQELRPHSSPYPKLAFQPPYFFSRESLERMVRIAPKIAPHLITPYVDWYMNALSCEAGMGHRPYTDLEHASHAGFPFGGSDPWRQLEYRIRYTGTNFVHPIKTQWQIDLCLEARKFYEGQS